MLESAMKDTYFYAPLRRVLVKPELSATVTRRLGGIWIALG